MCSLSSFVSDFNHVCSFFEVPLANLGLRDGWIAHRIYTDFLGLLENGIWEDRIDGCKSLTSLS